MDMEFLESLGIEGEAAEKLLEENVREQEGIRKEYEKKMLGSVLNAELLRYGARNPKTVLPLLETSKLSLKGDSLTGLREQLDGIREENPFLFDRPGEEPSERMDSGVPHSARLPEEVPATLAGALRVYYRQGE